MACPMVTLTSRRKSLGESSLHRVRGRDPWSPYGTIKASLVHAKPAQPLPSSPTRCRKTFFGSWSVSALLSAKASQAPTRFCPETP